MRMTAEGFYWREENDRQNNLEFVILGYQDGTNREHNLEAWIAPSHGSNLCRLSAGGKNIIDFEPELLAKSDFTGTPVLYPTPNRVRNGVFRYQGKAYPQVKRGTTVYEHGLVHNEPWQHQQPEVKPASISLKTWIDFDTSSAMFEAFPFMHRLMLEFNLTETGIKVTYSIENKDEQAIPFGFGLHPYFMKLSGDESTCVELPANYVMDYTSDCLPTGRLIKVAGTIYDIRHKTSIGALDLDHVFTGNVNGRFARISYDTLGMQVKLITTSDFSHLVLYSPRGAGFFCLENQTCSTDAHNLSDQNFKPEAGLKFVLPGQNHSGSVTYQITKEGSDEN
jgi:aldose 1-epimerase